MTPAILAKRILIAIVCLVVGIYGVDYLWLQLRLESKNPAAAMDIVTRFDATLLKNGKVQIFDGQPIVQRCVHSLLPHMGYLKRAGQDIKQISQFAATPMRDSSSPRSSE